MMHLRAWPHPLDISRTLLAVALLALAVLLVGPLIRTDASGVCLGSRCYGVDGTTLLTWTEQRQTLDIAGRHLTRLLVGEAWVLVGHREDVWCWNVRLAACGDN